MSRWKIYGRRWKNCDSEGSASILLAHFGILPKCKDAPVWKPAIASKMLALPIASLRGRSVLTAGAHQVGQQDDKLFCLLKVGDHTIGYAVGVLAVNARLLFSSD